MTLERGEFERGGKTTGKNIEVTVQVLDNEGKLLEVRVDCHLIHFHKRFFFFKLSHDGVLKPYVVLLVFYYFVTISIS